MAFLNITLTEGSNLRLINKGMGVRGIDSHPRLQTFRVLPQILSCGWKSWLRVVSFHRNRKQNLMPLGPLARGDDMAKKHRGHGEDAWRNAKKICRLNARQIEMARALGMNPRKLPRLRPAPHERWKLPVGDFIEECYRKRFGENPPGHHAHADSGPQQLPSAAQRHVPAREGISDAAGQVADLACYCVNLADDLETVLTKGTASAGMLPAIAEELRAIAEALENGRSISPFPEITLPSGPRRRASSRESDQDGTFDDDIPF
jgi:hypothetical protein